MARVGNNEQAVTSQPKLVYAPVEGRREWSTGLCGCFEDIGICLLGATFPLMLDMRTAGRLGECCCLPVCVPASTIAMRTKIRTLGGIEGSICADACVVSCFGPCASCQMARELNNMGL